MICVCALGGGLTHLRWVLIPGGLGFTVRTRREARKHNFKDYTKVVGTVTVQEKEVRCCCYLCFLCWGRSVGKA